MIEGVIITLRERAKSHRKVALFYTFAVFATIFLAIAAYYYFQQSKLQKLEQSNRTLGNEYTNVLKGLNAASDELKKDMASTKEVLTVFYDSLRRQTQAANSLSVSINQKVAAIQNDIDLASMNEAKVSFDSINVQFETFVAKGKSIKDRMLRFHAGELDRYNFLNQYQYRINPYRNRDTLRLIDLDTMQLVAFRSIMTQAVSRLDRARFDGFSFKNKYVREDWNKEIKSIQGDISSLTQDVELIRKRISYNLKLLNDYEQSVANFVSFEPDPKLSAKVQLMVRQIQTLNQKLHQNSQQFAALSNSLQYLTDYTLIVDQSDMNPLNTLKRLHATINRGIVQTDSMQRRYAKFATAAATNNNNVDDFYGNLPELLARYGLIIFLIYVIQLILSYAKYHYRLASFYDSKCDALQLRADLNDIKTTELISLLDSSQVNFGRGNNIFRTVYQEAKDLKNVKR